MTTSLTQHIQDQLSRRFGKEISITTKTQVYGGDINTTYRLAANEKTFFVKVNEASKADMFIKEANGLTLLRQNSRLKVPEPLLNGVFGETSFLVTECLHKTKNSNEIWQCLGRELAGMHRSTQDFFGLNEDNYIGTLPQSNKATAHWADFYAEQRILPLITRACNIGKCDKTDVQAAETLCSRLPAIFPDEQPALLHGDLWSGNFMACEEEQAAVYDPAVYYGNREMDIAMTLLFGGFEKPFYETYNEAYPLEKNWRQRTALCQLYPLLVHLNLFGGSYYKSVKNVLKTYA